MRRLLCAIVVFGALTGCAESPLQKTLTGQAITLTLKDAVSAQDLLVKSAPLLPAGDPWANCMQTIQGMIQAVQAGPGAVEPTNGILTEASRLHVLDSMLSQASKTTGQATCA